MTQRLFKYTSAQTAASILLRKKLRWSAPELFNDPFEFKSPFQFNFDWKAVESSFTEEMTRLITQDSEPELLEDGPTTEAIRRWRRQYQTKPDLDALLKDLREVAAQIADREKALEPEYTQKWNEMRRNYRVICFSEVANNILMWSHYADAHKGVVLGFQTSVQVATNLSYLRDVPSPVTLHDYIGYLTSQRSKPDTRTAFNTCIYTKSEEWSYERELRGFRINKMSGNALFDDIEFDDGELKEIYFGCRMSRSSKEEILVATRTFQTRPSFFQMIDEPMRFELMPIALSTDSLFGIS